MKKKALFILAIFFGFMVPVYAKEIDLTEDWDMEGVPYEVTEDLTINGNGHTIKGYFTLVEFPTEEIHLVIKDAIIDGEGTAKIVTMPKANYVGFSIEIDNVDFLNYKKAALDLGGLVTSIDIKNSLFDSSLTTEIDGIVCDEYCELEKRSAAALDLNFRASINSAEGTENCPSKITLGSYNLENNIFKNVIIADADLETSTAGAIKLKIKELHDCLQEPPMVVMKDNQFINNTRDMVIGTSSVVGESTSVEESGDFYLFLSNNGAMKILNNATSETLTYEERLTNYSSFQSENAKVIILNFYSNEGVESLIGVDFDKNIIYSDIVNARDVHNFLTSIDLFDVYNFVDDANLYVLSFAYDKIKTDLTNTVKDLSLNVSKTTTNNKLKDYEDGFTLFIDSNESGELPVEKVTYSFKTSYAENTKLYLYLVNEEGLLEKEAETVVDNKSYAAFDVSHFSEYVISDADLLATNPETASDGSVALVIALVLAMLIMVGFVAKKNRLCE